MAGAAVWKGYIRFGETSVGVKLHAAVSEERVQFHLLHSRDTVRLRQQMVCSYDQQPVPPDEQIKGFEVAEGKYVLLDPAELERTEPENDRAIEVREFVRTAEIAPVFLGRVYDLEADDPAMQGRGYRALAAALRELAIAAICTWTMRKRSYVGALHEHGDVLRLSILRYADEVVAASSLGLQDAPVSEREVAIGLELIAKMTAGFDPGRLRDEHQEKLREMIMKKARGEKLALVAPLLLRPTEPEDLLQTLAASLKKAA